MKWRNRPKKYKSISKKIFKSTAIMLILCSIMLYFLFGILAPYSYTIYINIYINNFIKTLQKSSTYYNDTNLKDIFINISKNKINYTYIMFDENDDCVAIPDYEYIYSYYDGSKYKLTKRQFDLACKYACQELDSDEISEFFLNGSLHVPDYIKLWHKKEFTITLEDNKPYTMYLYFYDHTSFTSNFPYLLIVFPIIFIIILLLSFVISFFYSRKISNPIVKISNTAKVMADYNLNKKCTIESNDELGILSKSLNELSSNLSNTIKELQIANNKLTTDVNNEKQMNKMKSNFFNAVSHEMKTPITILKGQLEGMLLNIGVYKNRDKYLKRSLEVTDSMENLLKELLTISRIESSTFKLNLEKCNLSNVINKALEDLNPLINKKNHLLKKHININTFAYVDVVLFKKVINNILLNAINYSPKSSIITVTLKNDTNTILEVTNSNSHINEEEINRLFEAFYRIDKSRSKDLGGTGLGLYIVKTILNMHKFKYCIFNTKKGVTFKIELM